MAGDNSSTEKILSTLPQIEIILLQEGKRSLNYISGDIIFTDVRGCFIPKKRFGLKKIGAVDPHAWGLLGSVTGGLGLIGIPISKFINSHISTNQEYDIRILDQIVKETDGFFLRYDDISSFTVKRTSKLVQFMSMSAPCWEWEVKRKSKGGTFNSIKHEEEASEEDMKKVIKMIQSYGVVKLTSYM